MKTLAELQRDCAELGITVETKGRASKEPYIAALRDHHWRKDHPEERLPVQIMPMLLGSWEDLDEEKAQEIEQDNHAWIVQPKLDGVRALIHIGTGGFRVTGRTISEVTYRLTEHQDHLRHLSVGWDSLEGTVLDGELVCPISVINTGSSITASTLQSVVGILATTPDKAANIQTGQNAHLEFHAFDVIRYRDKDVTSLPLYERLALLERILGLVRNPFVKLVPTGTVGKRMIHDRVLDSGGEGTVWKRLDSLYFFDRRVPHWIKRKRSIAVEGFVSSWKPGNNGHAATIGAVEFSIREADGSSRPIAWVNGWSDKERQEMTHIDAAGKVMFNLAFLGRKALIQGHDHSAKAGRIRHAKILRWLDQ